MATTTTVADLNECEIAVASSEGLMNFQKFNF